MGWRFSWLLGYLPILGAWATLPLYWSSVSAGASRSALPHSMELIGSDAEMLICEPHLLSHLSSTSTCRVQEIVAARAIGASV